VTEIAARLFDLTRPLHGLGPADLWLLRLAAVVHDVGRAVCDKTHPLEGARLLLSEPYLPLSASERRHLAYLTLHHKGPVPEARRDTVLETADDADRLRRVLALLRAADALDSRSVESPRLVFALAGPRPGGGVRTLRVTCYLDRDSPKARRVYTRRKKFRLLEDLFGCRVEVDIAEAEALEMVA
jgi:exopolyphosphatase/pppGpp-phosphohydrolase